MNFKKTGATKRQKPSLRRGTGSIEHTADHLAAPGTLSTRELRRLVADMVD